MIAEVYERADCNGVAKRSTSESVQQEGDGSKESIEQLANFITAQCPREIGLHERGLLPCGEGASAVAIRLLGRMADGIGKALLELGVPDGSYPAPVANSVKILRDALGLWGKT